MTKNQKGGGILDIITRRKKLGRGAFGKVVTPNYSCPGFKRKEGYVSKLASGSDGMIEAEIRILDRIKSLDKNQEYLVSMETYCKTKQPGWKVNIIMKNFGKDIMRKKVLPTEELVNVFLKQLLSGLIILHKSKIFHRDIAHRNIIYSEEENKYRFIDFGWSLDYKDVVRTFKNIDRYYNMNELVGKIRSFFKRGDGMHEIIEFPKELNKIIKMVRDDIHSNDKIKNEIIKHKDILMKKILEHQALLDIISVFEIAKVLTREKDLPILEKKIDKKVIKMLVKMKYTLTAKEIYDLLYKRKKTTEKR